MKISEIQKLLDAKVLCCDEHLTKEVYSAFGCDLMSDVLTSLATDKTVLLTGLVNPQVIRTALMMDMVCIIFVRSKAPNVEMIELAKENGIVMMSTDKTLYTTCGLLYSNGIIGTSVAPK